MCRYLCAKEKEGLLRLRPVYTNKEHSEDIQKTLEFQYNCNCQIFYLFFGCSRYYIHLIFKCVRFVTIANRFLCVS